MPTNTNFSWNTWKIKKGHHLFVYPFRGASGARGHGFLISYRLGLFGPQTFSFAMNDYGFELLSDQPIPIQDALDSDIFSSSSAYERIW